MTQSAPSTDLPRRKTPRRRRERQRPVGGPAVVRIGTPREGWRDLYHRILTLRWSLFFATLIGAYLGLNIVFAVLFALQPGSVAMPHPGSLLDDFFFSLETMSTVGYGEMYPATLYAHGVVSLEILFGVLVVPIATGLIIAKFTRPTAHVIFSRNVLVAPFDGVPTLTFRLANLRNNQIIEARVKLTLLRQYETSEGARYFRLTDLTLSRDTSPMFGLSWTVMHPIDAQSPLYGLSPSMVEAMVEQLLVVMTGIDGTTSVTVHARANYAPEAILFGQRFEDVLTPQPDGKMQIDFSRFDAFVPTG
jgi:inward rectifier potassium channel